MGSKIINKNFFLILIMYLISLSNFVDCQINNYNYNKSNGEECSANLHCNSGCCSGDKCSEIDDCSISKIYVIQAIVCIAIVAAFSIYLFIKLKWIKADFEKNTKSAEKVE